VIRRARAATMSSKSLALHDVYGRLVTLLQSLDSTERVTHLELAARLGCSREMVSRLLGDLTKGGYIDVSEGRITVSRPLPARW
jgi:CRP/FNR family cyclic AMP-dependent transcriptional regulator